MACQLSLPVHPIRSMSRHDRLPGALPLRSCGMFFTYLRRELRRRMRQAVFIALGLALGVGLVVTVAAASAGGNKAQSGVLSALYGVGTDITVTGNAPPPHYSSAGSTQPAKATPPPSKNGQTLQISPGGGAQICDNGHCVNAAGP